MDLSSVTKIDVQENSDLVNEYLALGWKLLSLYATSYDTGYPGCNHQTQHYVLGWFGDDPQYPKYPEYVDNCDQLF